MNFLCFLLCVGCLVGVIVGYPARQAYRIVPKRAVMFSGYYNNNPLFGRSYDFIPQGSMSAVVTRDTVATNSFAAPPQSAYPPIVELPLEDNETIEKYTEKVDTLPQLEVIPEAPSEETLVPVDIPLAEEVAVAEEVSTETVVAARVPKKQAAKKPAKEEEEEQGLSALWPFAASKGSVPSYNAFFPINISGASSPSRSRTGGEEDYYPGSATAIANSFSTGKGGIATSHATSFGDPYLSALVRNALLNSRSKRPQEV